MPSWNAFSKYWAPLENPEGLRVYEQQGVSVTLKLRSSWITDVLLFSFCAVGGHLLLKGFIAPLKCFHSCSPAFFLRRVVTHNIFHSVMPLRGIIFDSFSKVNGVHGEHFPATNALRDNSDSFHSYSIYSTFLYNKTAAALAEPTESSPARCSLFSFRLSSIFDSSFSSSTFDSATFSDRIKPSFWIIASSFPYFLLSVLTSRLIFAFCLAGTELKQKRLNASNSRSSSSISPLSRSMSAEGANTLSVVEIQSV